MTSSNTTRKTPESAHQRLIDFVKTALIKIFVSPYATVCELYCGKVCDEEKWDEAQIGHYIGVDGVPSGVSDVRQAWESQRKTYTSHFFELDPCIENIELQSEDKGNMADIVCCMQHLQFCFETEERVRRLLYNVSSLLKPGGYFLGITPDSSTIWYVIVMNPGVWTRDSLMLKVLPLQETASQTHNKEHINMPLPLVHSPNIAGHRDSRSEERDEAGRMVVVATAC
ncbi:hypothetical protein RJ639_037309 [Escallonia herrerae]|uniref:mRNA (guanine-N(7))-methyltransferase n=1 Tax=Escallonia herrerae TaxID=1293975 RepID=A0AA88WPX5_9ASTE|nr:hypothetical protein RJ639_037309 [Escallonia herrerae]